MRLPAPLNYNKLFLSAQKSPRFSEIGKKTKKRNDRNPSMEQEKTVVIHFVEKLNHQQQLEVSQVSNPKLSTYIKIGSTTEFSENFM